ncbi:MAG: hypothetical protein FJZ01_26775 [Candidatus Sericytochromatia bacterium]|nr:hypothetical protein [Candidatus Tanganyikabacteria bacterium]
MTDAFLAASVLGITVSLSLAKPRLRGFRFDHAAAAVLGALLVGFLGLVTPAQIGAALASLAEPIATIVSLMVVTLVAERAGVFQVVAAWLVRAAGGDCRQLLALLFFVGAGVGMVFTNDAAILIFTPLVVRLVAEISDETWTDAQKMPFYFAVLYVANLVGALVISNPINIVVASLFDIGFVTYAAWMLLPALGALAATYLGLLWAFGRDLPKKYRIPAEGSAPRPAARAAGGCLVALLVAFFAANAIGLPIWAVAAAGAAAMLVGFGLAGVARPTAVLRGVGWDAVVFLAGIFVVATAVRQVGLTARIGEGLAASAGGDPAWLLAATSFTAAGLSAVLNNHPTAGLMALAIKDMAVPEGLRAALAYAALIGGDLGPKMLPIGSLAALLWVRMLHDRGVRVSYRLMVKVGVPITLFAVAVATLALIAEYRLQS